MDFYRINVREIEKKNGESYFEIYPEFIIKRSKDLMIRGRSFYAIWDDEKQIWSTDESDVQRLVDAELKEHASKYSGKVSIKYLSNFSSKTWTNYRLYINNMFDTSQQLDNNIVFSNTSTKKTDYVSHKLSYPLEEGTIDAYEELMSTLYDPEERAKLEWAVGSIIAGESKELQKFIVLYGEAGSGKSTFLNIVQKLFAGYYTMFEAKALASSNNSFSTEVFRTNPLIAIQHDGDLSKIEDNTKLNSIVAHEEMTLNEKYKASYTSKMNCFLFMGTNRPVKITDANSGIIRRLIDVKPSLRKLPPKRYHTVMSQIDFELGAIAHHCLQIYRAMGKNYYSAYRPLDMMMKTDVFFNYVEANYHIFKEQDGVNLSRAYEMYKTYCDESLVEFKLPRHKFREELKSYFKDFFDVTRIDGKQVRSYYGGFLSDKFTSSNSVKEDPPHSLNLDNRVSSLDELLAMCPAQYANANETPEKRWDECKTVLSDLNTEEIHYVKLPEGHIVIDFDIKNEQGEKSLDRNLDAASSWPKTYAEVSKSGKGIHLHYIYDGDPTKLSRIYSEGIEIKVFTGNSSLRRRLTKCNNIPIATINSGLPLKGDKPMINFEVVKSEKKLREFILRNLNKEIHPSTKPSIDFIKKILDDAYASGMPYDLTDMRPRILAFANNSTNQADYCIKLVNKMQFASEQISEPIAADFGGEIIFFDVEVFPNLFVVVWKARGKARNKVRMINPSPKEIEELLKFKLVGFNCRRYDNHILYARYIGYDNEQLYELSQKIVDNSRNGLFGEAYNISYADVYDFSSKKQSLKKFQLELGIHHKELGLPWDQPVPEELWPTVAEYCDNDVDSLEVVFEAQYQDFVGRQILADLSGLTVNDTTQMHTAKIIFGDDKRPQEKFIYTDLSEMFPGYVYEAGKSTYRGEETGEGGYVYAEPGMYRNVAVLDIASMHPTSLVCMDMFGPYTKNFDDLLKARIAIKHKDYEAVKNTLGGALSKYLTGDDQAVKDLAYSLKIIINSVYGFTSAKFENKFKDPRNKDNIVAKRGALFMIDLKHAVQERGFTVAHIKTDSIKIPNATPEIIDFVFEFGKRYGYTFEHEGTYDRMCLVNDAVYIAKFTEDTALVDRGTGKKVNWSVVGKQFLVPYVFKKITRESIYLTTSGVVDLGSTNIQFSDLCEDKTVTTALYLDMNESLPEEEHDYHFVGKAGKFSPIKPGCGGGLLLREKDGKYNAATGSKGYRWLESEMVKELGKEADIDETYYMALADSAIKDISEFGDFEWFVDDVDNPIGFNDMPPAMCVANGQTIMNCATCPNNDTCDGLPF